MSIDGFSLTATVSELDKKLAGARIDKVFQPRSSEFYFTVRLPGDTLLLHISLDPRFPAVFLAKTQPENPPVPPTFCMLLRKQLEGGRIDQVRHINCDRVMAIDIDTLGSGNLIVTKTLYIELAGKYSNLILVQDDLIVDSLKHIGTNNSRVRIILPTRPYLPPVQSGINILEATADAFWAEVQATPEKSLYRAVLNSGAGFGPVTARAILAAAALDETKVVNTLNEPEKVALINAVQALAELCRQGDFTFNALADDKGKVTAVAPFPLTAPLDGKCYTFATMSELLAYAQKKIAAYVPPEKEILLRLANNELNKQLKKATKLADEITAALGAETEKIKADNLMTYQYNYQDHHDEQITVDDIYSNTPLQIKLDKRLSIIQNMQQYYRKYDKLRRSENILKEQLAFCQAEADYLKTVIESLRVCRTSADINDVKVELTRTGYLKASRKKLAAMPASKPLKISLSDGATLLIGKNNLQNDQLTFKTATPNDLWLHTKDIPGSHVILRTVDEPTSEQIELAAQFAAFFSQAKESSKVPVDYVKRRFVKKPAGAKPGFVIFTNNKTLYVTPDAPLLQKYLPDNLHA